MSFFLRFFGKELGINDDHEGIMILSQKLELGINIKDALLIQEEDIADVNVKGAYNCALAALEIMRPQGQGTIITTSSKAGVNYSPRAGVAYGASKHAVMALNQLMNIEEGNNGIRACVLCPGEVETPILDHRPIPVPKEERERLIQSEDMGEIVVFIMKLPARVTLNEVIISPTYTRPLQPGEG